MAVTHALDLAELGRQKGAELLDAEEDTLPAVELFDPEFADGALAEFERARQDRFRGVVRKMMRGGHRYARRMHPEPTQGLVEINQNADDQGAREVRFAIERQRGNRYLLASHDGGRVRLDHIVGMVFPFVSGKLDDAEAFGQWGIGMKTIRRLGEPLWVHCAPFHFVLEQDGLHRCKPSPAMAGLYDPTHPDTLLRLQLSGDVGADVLTEWMDRRSSADLLFLKSVQRLVVVDGQSGKEVLAHGLRRGRTRHVRVRTPAGEVGADRTTLTEETGSRRWDRWTARAPTVEGIAPAEKDAEETTRIAVALPARPTASRFFAGLPLDEPSELPFSVGAYFDPDGPRTHLEAQSPWNAWLLERLQEFAAGVLVHRLAERPSTAWHLIPHGGMSMGRPGTWLAELGSAFVARIRSFIAEHARIEIDSRPTALANVSYEARSLDGLLDRLDLRRVLAADVIAVPPEVRDAKGRWRDVLADLGVATAVDSAQALELLADERGQARTRGGTWVVALAAAALADGVPRVKLDGAHWVLTDDGRQLSPAALQATGTVLVTRHQEGSLADRLGLVAGLHPDLRSRAEPASLLRRWLKDNGLLSTTPSDRAALASLAGRQAMPPVDLSADASLVVALRDALAAAPVDRREHLARRVGGNVLVRGYRWSDAGRSTAPVPPSAAYLGAAYDRSGFARAAARTPDLHWIDPSYVKALRRPKAAGADDEGLLSPRGLFLALGARTAPRLVEREKSASRYTTRAVRPPYPRLAQHQKEIARGGYEHPHFARDHDSPDMQSVVEDIAAERDGKQRVARARALVECMAAPSAFEHYRHRARVDVLDYHGSGGFYKQGQIRATWAAQAASVPWMSNGAGRRKAPRELALDSPDAHAVLGLQPQLYCREFVGTEVSDDVAAILDFLALEVEPRTSTIVGRLEELRGLEQRGEPIDDDQPARCYAALARRLRAGDAAHDLSADELARRMRAGDGLVRADVGWRRPSQVSRGPVLRGLQPTIEPRGADRLWTKLNIEPPTVGDCESVLRAQAEQGRRVSGPVLTRILRHIERLLASRPGTSKSLASLPLPADGEWLHRPVRCVEDPLLARELAEHGITTWRCPCPTAQVPATLAALGVDVIGSEELQVPEPPPGAFVAAEEALRDVWSEAIGLLDEQLYRDEPELWDVATLAWTELAAIPLALQEDLAATLVVDGATVPVGLGAARLTDRRGVVVRSAADAADADAGGRVVGAFFRANEARRRYVALAWNRAFVRAEEGQRAVATGVASSEAAADPLQEWAQRADERGRTRGERRGKLERSTTAGGGASNQPPSPPPRQLKEPDEVEIEEIELIGDGAQHVAPPSGRRRVDLRDPAKGSSGSGTPGEPKPPRTRRPRADTAYDEQDVQALGLEVLERQLREQFGVALVDQHRLQRVGADATDDLGSVYIELKASAGELSDTVTLTPHEAKRALTSRSNYLLAVVAGLQRGSTTRVRIFSDPLYRLEIVPDRRIRLSGVRTKPTVRGITVR
jgi:hypothetical protein